jgi:YggT family protein
MADSPSGFLGTASYTARVNVAVILVNDVATLLDIYAICILAWALLSFFPGGAGSSVGRLLDTLVMPVIQPLRRLLPTMAGMDFSPLLAIVMCYALAGVLTGMANAGFINPAGTVVTVVLDFFSAVLLIIVLLLLVRVLLGFLHVDPWHPLVFSIKRITDTFVGPVGRAVRTTGETAAITTLVVFLVVYIGVAQILFPVIQGWANRI